MFEFLKTKSKECNDREWLEFFILACGKVSNMPNNFFAEKRIIVFEYIEELVDSCLRHERKTIDLRQRGFLKLGAEIVSRIYGSASQNAIKDCMKIFGEAQIKNNTLSFKDPAVLKFTKELYAYGFDLDFEAWLWI